MASSRPLRTARALDPPVIRAAGTDEQQFLIAIFIAHRIEEVYPNPHMAKTVTEDIIKWPLDSALQLYVYLILS